MLCSGTSVFDEGKSVPSCVDVRYWKVERCDDDVCLDVNMGFFELLRCLGTCASQYGR